MPRLTALIPGARALTLLALVTCPLSAGASGIPSTFVSVDSLTFQADNRPYHFAGTNCCYLMTRAADPSLRSEVDEVLLEAALMNMEVVRTWAFNDGDGWNTLQTGPGVYYPQDSSTVAVLEDHAEQMRQLGDLTAVGENPPAIVRHLGTPFPNPFVSRMNCRIEGLATDAPLRVKVHDLSGRMVATIFEGTPVSSHATVSWNGLLQDARPAATGVYSLRFDQNGQREARHLVLLR